MYSIALRSSGPSRRELAQQRCARLKARLCNLRMTGEDVGPAGSSVGLELAIWSFEPLRDTDGRGQIRAEAPNRCPLRRREASVCHARSESHGRGAPQSPPNRHLQAHRRAYWRIESVVHTAASAQPCQETRRGTNWGFDGGSSGGCRFKCQWPANIEWQADWP